MLTETIAALVDPPLTEEEKEHLSQILSEGGNSDKENEAPSGSQLPFDELLQSPAPRILLPRTAGMIPKDIEFAAEWMACTYQILSELCPLLTGNV